MGAYYNAATEDKDGNLKRFDPWTGGGVKLMEHSYIGNDYVGKIMEELLDSPKELSWICDYSEDGYYNWEVFPEYKEPSTEKIIVNSEYYIYNHTKKVMIDIFQLVTEDGWDIHPLPILCNSEQESAGGGDFHQEDSRRGTWLGDEIEVSFDKKKYDYKDVSTDCIFVEQEGLSCLGFESR